MNCETVERDGIIERYVAGRLTGEERDDFEAHYFTCDRCFAALETGDRMRAGFQQAPGLETAASATNASPTGASPTGASATAPGPRWLVAGVAAAAVVIVAGVFTVRAVVSPRVPASVAALGQVDPATLPAYVATRQRAAGSLDSATTLFEQGMEAYVLGDHSRAVESLRHSVDLDASRAVRHFYLGASLLVLGDADEAAAALEVAIAEPELASEAGFLLAKAHLQLGAVEKATDALDRVIRAGGARAAEASAIKADLERNSRE